MLGAQYAIYGVLPMFSPALGRGTGIGAAVAFGRFGTIAGPLAAGELLALGLSSGGVALSMAPLADFAGVTAYAAVALARYCD